jgi:predicted outer membrane repeat protein
VGLIAGILGVCALHLALTPAALAAPAAPAVDVVVTNCASDAQLRAAAIAPGVTNITFNCGPGSHTIPIGSRMEIQGDVTINGAGRITLDGGGVSDFFQVFSTASLDLRDLTLQRGTDVLGAPLENFGTLRLARVQALNSQMDSENGFVTNADALNVVDSVFSGLTVQPANVALSARGAAIVNDGGVASISGSGFTNNKAAGNLSRGGAIANVSGTLNIDGAYFTGNNALDGGALFIAAGSVATVTQSSFIANTAGYGGAIESNGQLDVNYTTLANNQANQDGGAIWVLSSDLDMAYSVVRNNVAGATGGGISCYANNISVINSTVSGNKATGNGGGIYSTCDLNLTNSTLSGNESALLGGGVYQGGSGVGTVGAVTAARNKAAAGAGVYNDGGGASTLTLQYTLLTSNTTGNCDGVIASNGYNLSSDNNCGGAFTQTGDQNNVVLVVGALRDNGGPTPTHDLPAGSPALDVIPTPCAFAEDQRGVTRPQRTKCDVGAFERETVLRTFVPLVAKP